MKKYIMALDQGTTSSRCILFDKEGRIISKAQREYPQIYPHPGWVEHDPMAIWSTQLSVATEALAKINADIKDVQAIGITNQRETTVVWDKKTGKPVYNAIVWQCRRTSEEINGLKPELKEYIKKKTGLIADAYFSASKIKWILDNVEGARKKAEEGRLLFGTIDTWILWNLSGGKVHATDYTNASRTMLFDIRKLKWDQKLLRAFEIPECMMPEVHPSGYDHGVSAKKFFGKNIPVCALVGDQQSALFGMACFGKGDVKNTYGTGCFLLMNTKKKPVESKNGLLTTIAAGLDDKPDYALEGSVFIGGAVLGWLKDELKIIKNYGIVDKAAGSVEDTNSAYLVPAFTGLGAPYWCQEARGTLVGITRGFNREHMIRASVESIAYQVHDVLKAMEKDADLKIDRLTVDGGASKNDLLMQFQSDIINADVNRVDLSESTAFGAVALAGLKCGFFKDEEDIRSIVGSERIFKNSMDKEKRKELLQGWKKAVKTALYWAK